MWCEALCLHDHRPRLGVDFGVEPRAADQVHDPQLSGLVIHAQPLSQRVGANGLQQGGKKGGKVRQEQITSTLAE